MSERMDPELEDALRDPELLRIARLLSAAKTPEPPLDDAFKSALRRQLMEEAWKSSDGRNSWWRRLIAPQGMAWAGAAALVVIVASVVVYTATQPGGGFQQVIVQSPQQDAQSVALLQPIQVKFSQPMDHSSTQAAVQITPATTVDFSWQGDTTLNVQPTSGNLAPNTQYEVTIGPTAKTLAGPAIDTPTTFTFVTQPPPSPAPVHPASPTPGNGLLTGQVQLASNIGSGSTVYAPIWSADSSTVYYVDSTGALDAVAAKGGPVKKLVAGSVSLPAIAPAGDRIAYVRNGSIEILTLATGVTTDLTVTTAPTALGWVKDKLFWGGGDGIFTIGDGGPVKVAASPDPAAAVVSIAPDGAHAVFQTAHTLLLVQVSNGSSVQLGPTDAIFQGWSPDGSRVMHDGVVADMNGKTIATLLQGDASWSSLNQVLVGGDTQLYVVRPDGSGRTKLADGTYHLPVWAPDSTTFAYVNGNRLLAASVPSLPPAPAAIDQAAAVVTSFMQARLDNNQNLASTYLDDAGKGAYSGGGPTLLQDPNLGFKRFYIVTIQLDPSSANAARVVVRLVFAHGKKENRAVEETLTLRRAEATDPFVIDAATVTSPRELGRGPEVVSVKVTATTVEVTFDSDLLESTIGNVVLVDGQGVPVIASATYSDRTVTFSGLQLVAGATYRLVVPPTVQDVSKRPVASQYDLEFIGPAPVATSGGGVPSTPPTGPSPTPSS